MLWSAFLHGDLVLPIKPQLFFYHLWRLPIIFFHRTPTNHPNSPSSCLGCPPQHWDASRGSTQTLASAGADDDEEFPLPHILLASPLAHSFASKEQPFASSVHLRPTHANLSRSLTFFTFATITMMRSATQMQPHITHTQCLYNGNFRRELNHNMT